MTEKQKEKLYIKIKSDPYWFIKNILEIKTITEDQKKIIESVRDNKLTAVKSGHNLGKTFIEACLAIWYLFVYRDSVVITTAPTARQVKDILWNEINNIIKNLSFDIGGYGKQYGYIMDTRWFATGITTIAENAEESAVRFQGYHAKNILVVMDEAIGIPPAIWEAIDGITNSDNAKILAVGNPATPNCTLKKKIDKGNWNIITVSALNHPNVIHKKEIIPGAVSYTWIKQKINEWCKEESSLSSLSSLGSLRKNTNIFEFEGKTYKANNLFLWKVLGEFPEESIDTLIPRKNILESFERFKNIKSNGLFTECYMSIDVARFGNDSSSVAILTDNRIIMKTFFHFDIAKLSGEIVHLIKKYNPSKVGVDCDGLGAGVFDNLNESVSTGLIDTELVEIHGGALPVDMGQTEDFLNLRAQMYWLLKQDIEILAIEENDNLSEGLSSIKYFFNSKGKIQIESKDDIRKRLGRSPDIEDAIAYVNFLKYSSVAGCASIDIHKEDKRTSIGEFEKVTERIGII